MTNEFVLEAINREFPDAVIASSEPFGFLTIEVKKEELKKIIHHLKESSLRFIFLTDICGIHYPEDKEKEFEIHRKINEDVSMTWRKPYPQEHEIGLPREKMDQLLKSKKTNILN